MHGDIADSRHSSRVLTSGLGLLLLAYAVVVSDTAAAGWHFQSAVHDIAHLRVYFPIHDKQAYLPGAHNK